MSCSLPKWSTFINRPFRSSVLVSPLARQGVLHSVAFPWRGGPCAMSVIRVTISWYVYNGGRVSQYVGVWARPPSRAAVLAPSHRWRCYALIAHAKLHLLAVLPSHVSCERLFLQKIANDEIFMCLHLKQTMCL